jgi:hypothetical protein
MRKRKNFHRIAGDAIKNAERKAGDSNAPNAGRVLNRKTVWLRAHALDRFIESEQVAGSQPRPALFVERDVLKVLRTSRLG